MNILCPTPATATQTTVPAQIRVAIVDDCPDVQFLLATIIGLDSRFTVVAETGGAADMLASVAAAEPDVVVVDLNLLLRTGPSMVRDLHGCAGRPWVVAMSTSTSRDHRAAAFAAAADAILEKSSMITTMADDLADAVNRDLADTPCRDRGQPRDRPSASFPTWIARLGLRRT